MGTIAKISAKDVNKLRQQTGVGMMDCKKALTESRGDFDKAIELLRKKGQKVSASRADRETSEGVIFARSGNDSKATCLLAFTCETDFVAKNEEFIELGNKIADLAFDKQPVSQEELYNFLLDGSSVGEKIVELTGKIGEKLEVKHFEVLKGELASSYVHSNGKLGVIVVLKNTGDNDFSDVGKEVAMQIAAMNPLALNESGVDTSIVEKEMEIARDLARKEDKPEQMIEKIAKGKLQKFFKEHTLLSQPFVKDNKKTILQYLDSVHKGMTVSEFKRINIS